MKTVSLATLRFAGLISLSVHLCAYAADDGHSAVARFSHDPATTFSVTGQPNKIQASHAVMGTCVRALELTAADGYCEIENLDGVAVTSTQSLLQDLPADRPLYLWEFSGAQSRVFIAGTVHILKQGLEAPRQYVQALEASQSLVVEVDLAKIAPQEMVATVVKYATKPDTWAQGGAGTDLNQALETYGIEPANLAGFKPAYVGQQLALLALIALGYSPELGIENQLLRQAASKQILELETLDQQLNLLLNQPPPIQTALLNDTLANLGKAEEQYVELVRAWLEGDDATFAEAFNRQARQSDELAEFMNQLMEQRNVTMAETISGYFSTPGTYLVLVGTGHLIGPGNIIELLKEKGFTAARITANSEVSPAG